MAEVKAKVNKAVVYKMISYKGKTGANNYTPLTAAQRLPKHERSIANGFSTLIAGLNSLGATLNSIAANVQNMVEFWRDAVRTQIKDTKALVKEEKKTDIKEEKRERKKEKQKFDQRKLAEREKDQEALKPKPKKFKSTLAKPAQKKKRPWWDKLLEFVGDMVKIAVFKVIADNPETINKLVKIIIAIGTFAAKAIEFLGGLALDGIIDFLENPISLKGFFGIFKFLIGAVPLFLAFKFLKDPGSLVATVGKVMGGMLEGLKRMFGMNSKADKLKQFKLKKIAGQKGNFFTTKAGKIATGLTVGVGTGMAIKASGGSDSEAVGGGIGATGGQMAGAAIGSAIGGPAGGMIGGVVGTMAGGAVGKAIGGLVEPIVGPIGDFFKQIGEVFNSVVADIKKPLEEFFSTLGAFLNGILDAVEPHLPLIGKIISVGLQVMFAPLFLGIRALTAVMKLFTGDKGGGDEEIKPPKEENKESGRTKRIGEGGGPTEKVTKQVLIAGMPVGKTLTKEQMAVINMSRMMDERNYQNLSPRIREMYEKQSSESSSDTVTPVPEKKAAGGWIRGPQKGYPVSLDGKSTSFIGHGTEWVGRKAGGKAFVVPFDTPATRQNKRLTGKRIGEAKRQGYSLPTAFDQRLNAYKSGGLVKPKKGFFGKAKDFLNKTPQVKLAKWLGGKASNLLGGKDEEGRPAGAMRWLAGAADQATGGFFDFDKRGHSLHQPAGVLQKSGEIIDNLKQKKNEERAKKMQAALDGAQPTVINSQKPAIQTGGGQSDSFPIIVPSDHDLDQDKYIMPKFGLIAEMKTDPVEFM